MCKQIGVDPLSSNKGFWVDVLGVGDFYYELAVSISNLASLDPNCEYLHRSSTEKRRLPRRTRLFALTSTYKRQQKLGDHNKRREKSC